MPPPPPPPQSSSSSPPPPPPILTPLNPTDTYSSTFYLPPPQNRHIGYSIHGVPLHHHHSSSPAAQTIFLLHGTPGSRLNAHLFTSLAATTFSSSSSSSSSPSPPKPIRIIGIDRPGYGLSTPLSLSSSSPLQDGPGLPQTAEDYMKNYAHTDLLPLADHLGISEFWVLGISGGGPWAAGVGCALGGDGEEGEEEGEERKKRRLRGTGILVGMGPTDTGSRLGLDWPNYIKWRATPVFRVMNSLGWDWWDEMVERVSERLFVGGNFGRNGSSSEKEKEEQIERMMRLTEKAWDNEWGDGKIFDRKEEGVTVRERMRMSLLEQGHQGGKGFGMDVLAIAGGGGGKKECWGFDWEKVDKVRLWYAGRDSTQTPVEMGRWYEERMKRGNNKEKDVKLRVYEEETHFSLVVGDRHIRGVFEELLSL